MKNIILYFTFIFLVTIFILYCNHNNESEEAIIQLSSSNSILSTTTSTLSLSTFTTTESTTTTLITDVYIYAAGYKFDLLPNCTTQGGAFFYVTKFDFNGNEDLSNWDKEYKTCGVLEAYSVAIDKKNLIYTGGLNVEVSACNLGTSNYQSWHLRKYDPTGNEICLSICSPFYIYPFEGGEGTVAFPGAPLRSMAIDDEGNIFATGFSYQHLVGDIGCHYRWEVLKINSEGSTEWIRRFDQAGDTFSPRLVIDNQSNVYAISNHRDLNSNSDWWIKKFDKNGVEDIVNWNKLVDSGNDEPWSDIGVDTVTTIAIDSSNNIYVLGEGCKLVSAGLNDIWLKKYSSDGIEDTVNWDKKFNGGPTKGAYYHVRAAEMAVDSKDNVYIVTLRENMGQWISIKKFTRNGVEITNGWNKLLNIPDGTYFWGRSMTIDKYDNIYISYLYDDTCNRAAYDQIIRFSEFGVQDLSFSVSKCDIGFYDIKCGTR